MSDSSVSDRRDEIRPNQPFPESLKSRLDEHGHLVLGELRKRPRLDARGRPLTDDDLGDLLTPVLNAAKFDPEQLPAAKGADIVTYIAALTGIRSLAKAVKEADAVAGAWSATVADYAAAKAELDAMRRDARTTVMVQANAGKPAALDAKTITSWRTLTDRVAGADQLVVVHAAVRDSHGTDRLYPDPAAPLQAWSEHHRVQQIPLQPQVVGGGAVVEGARQGGDEVQLPGGATLQKAATGDLDNHFQLGLLPFRGYLVCLRHWLGKHGLSGDEYRSMKFLDLYPLFWQILRA